MSKQKQNSINLPVTAMRNRLAEKRIRVTIREITWERVILHLTCRVEGIENVDPARPLDFYAVTSFLKANAKFRAERIDEKPGEPADGNDDRNDREANGGVTYRLSLNVTNPGYCRCLPTETYRFLVCQGNDILAAPEVSEELTPLLPDKSREFLYSSRNGAYIVDFSIAEDDSALYPEMRVLNAHRAAIEPYSTPDTASAGAGRGSRLKGRVKDMIRAYYAHEAKKYDRSFTGTVRTVLFLTEQSERLGSNLTAVYRRMQERGLDQNFEILISARSAVEKKYGEKSWLRLIRDAAKADMIFIDDHCPFLDWLTLSSRTKLIQLWHAGAGFKSSGYSRWGHTGCPGPTSGHRQYDYGITSSARIAHFYSEVFGINPEQLLPTGMPRMDEFLDPAYRKETEKKLRARFPQIEGKEVILFAPTYRGKNRKDAHYPYEMIDFGRLNRFCGDQYAVLFKMHPWVSEPVPIPEECRDSMIDVSRYPNINDLFYITDLLITDYSSSIFEFSLMRKPMLFFAFDEVQYAYSRGFHRPYEESAPGKVCRSFSELMAALESRDFEEEKVEEYVKFHFDVIDSGASDRVIDWILLGSIPEESRRRLEEIDRENQRLLEMDFSSLA